MAEQKVMTNRGYKFGFALLLSLMILTIFVMWQHPSQSLMIYEKVGETLIYIGLAILGPKEVGKVGSRFAEAFGKKKEK